MNPDNDAPAQFPEGSNCRRYAPLPGDIVEVRSDFLVKHHKAYGVRIGTVERDAGGDAWWVALPGYEKTIRFEVGDLTLAWRAKS